MGTEIRKALPGDIKAIHGMMRDFAEFEKLLDWFEITESKLADVLFGKDSYVEALLASIDDEPVGYAFFFPCFASFRGQRGLYLEDLYIAAEYRGRGVGEAMLREIARSGKASGFERIDFQVIDWNESAMRFYKRLGGVAMDGTRYFKFSDKAFLNLAD
jgi:ribosomal protein S18 acetylase RimI-like enzyme